MTSSITRRDGGTRREAVGIRRATARDAKRLTRLVRASRAYEGHYAAMVAGYRVGPDYIETHRVFAAVEPGTDRLLGFYSLVLAPPELDLMFVADAAQGLGIGRLLIGHLRGEAERAGLTGVRIVSHPPAEGFYRSVGAHRTGTLAADPPAVMWDRPELLLPVGRPDAMGPGRNPYPGAGRTPLAERDVTRRSPRTDA